MKCEYVIIRKIYTNAYQPVYGLREVFKESAQ